MVQKEQIDLDSSIVNNKILYPSSAKRGSNGDWSIELYLDLEIELEDGRKLVIDNRCLQLRAKQIGRREKKRATLNAKKEQAKFKIEDI